MAGWTLKNTAAHAWSLVSRLRELQRAGQGEAQEPLRAALRETRAQLAEALVEARRELDDVEALLAVLDHELEAAAPAQVAI